MFFSRSSPWDERKEKWEGLQWTEGLFSSPPFSLLLEGRETREKGREERKGRVTETEGEKGETSREKGETLKVAFLLWVGSLCFSLFSSAWPQNPVCPKGTALPPLALRKRSRPRDNHWRQFWVVAKMQSSLLFPSLECLFTSFRVDPFLKVFRVEELYVHIRPIIDPFLWWLRLTHHIELCNRCETHKITNKIFVLPNPSVQKWP